VHIYNRNTMVRTYSMVVLSSRDHGDSSAQYQSNSLFFGLVVLVKHKSYKKFVGVFYQMMPSAIHNLTHIVWLMLIS